MHLLQKDDDSAAGFSGRPCHIRSERGDARDQQLAPYLRDVQPLYGDAQHGRLCQNVRVLHLAFDDLEVPLAKRDGGGGGSSRGHEDVEGFEAALEGVGVFGCAACQELPLPFELQGALPIRETFCVTDPLPPPTFVHDASRDPRPTFELFVVLAQPSIQVDCGTDIGGALVGQKEIYVKWPCHFL